MKCDLSLGGAALPTLPLPVLVSPQPLRLVRFYVHALEFQLHQHIPGVFAALSSGLLPLQVWGRRDARRSRACVTLEPGDPSVFDLHRQLRRVGPALLDGPSPRALGPHGWQFLLTDIDGNQLVFTQWGRHGRAADLQRRRGEDGAVRDAGGLRRLE